MRTHSPQKVVFVSPGPRCHGGISAVVNNYSHSRFYSENGCHHYGTCLESKWKLISMAYSMLSILFFPFFLLLVRPEIVSVHSSSGGSFYRKFLIIIFSSFLRHKIVWHIHPSHFYTFFQNGTSGRKWLINLAAKKSHRIVFLTEEMQTRFGAFWPKEKLSVLDNPVNVSDYSDNRKSSFEGNYNVLYLGWIIQQKGVYDLLEVVPQILREIPEVKFHFAGNKEVEKLKRLVSEQGLSEYVYVHGWVSGTEKHDLLKAARLLVLPSYTEGIPNVVLEAMASGLPVITTPVGGIPSIFEEEVNGYFVTPGDNRALAKAIRKLLVNDQLCNKISESTYETALNRFDVEVIGNRLKAIYL